MKPTLLVLSLLAVSNVSAAPEGRSEGPALRSLRSAESAATASAQGSPESQANLIGVSFNGGSSDGAVPVPAATEPRPDPKPPGPNLIFRERAPGEPEIPLPIDRKDVRTVRTVGSVAAVAGLAWIVGAVALGAAFPVWGAALLFFGGLAAYMANRNL